MEQNKFFSILLIVTYTVCSFPSIVGIHFEDCGSTANITELRVSSCTEPPCIFIKGETYEIEIDAISECTSSSLPYKVTAKVEFLPITILKGDACDVLTKGSCPVGVGQEFTYKNLIKVNPSFPSFHTKVTALVEDDKKESVICLRLEVEIKKSLVFLG